MNLHRKFDGREIRNENWEAATTWQKSAWDYTILAKGEKLNHLISGLYLLEGLIIFMVHKMDTKNYRVTGNVNRFFCTLFRKLEEISKYCLILQPRYGRRELFSSIQNP